MRVSQVQQPVQSTIPFKRDSAGSDASLAPSGVAVLVLSLIAIAAVLVIRKRLRFGQAPAGQASMLTVLETRRLGPRALVSVVAFSGTHYLLAHGEHGVSCIATVPASERP